MHILSLHMMPTQTQLWVEFLIFWMPERLLWIVSQHLTPTQVLVGINCEEDLSFEFISQFYCLIWQHDKVEIIAFQNKLKTSLLQKNRRIKSSCKIEMINGKVLIYSAYIWCTWERTKEGCVTIIDRVRNHLRGDSAPKTQDFSGSHKPPVAKNDK